VAAGAPDARRSRPVKQQWRLRLFLARVSAYALDVLVTAAVVLVSQLVIWKLGFNPVVGDPTAARLHLWVALTVDVPVLAYFVSTTRAFGATFGTWVLKLQVTRTDDESRPPLLRVVLRYLIVLAPFEVNHTAMFHGWWWAFIAVYVLVGLLLASMLLQKEGRGVHDLAAGTRVIRRHGA